MDYAIWILAPKFKNTVVSRGISRTGTAETGDEGSPLPFVSASQWLDIAGKAPGACSEQDSNATNKWESLCQVLS